MKVITVRDQFALRLAGVAVCRAFDAVLTQTLQIRLRASENQRGFATGRITDHAHLPGIEIGASKGSSKAVLIASEICSGRPYRLLRLPRRL